MKSILPAFVLATVLMPGGAQATDLRRPSADELSTQHPYATGPALRQFYVRADLGIARHSFGNFSQSDLAENGGGFLSREIDDAPTIGAGIGWQLNSRLRMDLTGEYRASSTIKALDNLSVNLQGPDGTLIANTQYQGNMSTIVGLLNGYWDLGVWRGITPYVGGGIGYSQTSMSGLTTLSTATFTDTATGAITTQVAPGVGDDKKLINFAWALMAGMSFDISNHAKLDLGYRYLNIGSDIAVASGLLNCVCGTVGQPLKIADLESHEIRIGLRVPFGAEAPSTAHRPLK